MPCVAVLESSVMNYRWLGILTMVVLMGTMQFSEIVEKDRRTDGLSLKDTSPAVIAFIIYLIAGNAECNRGHSTFEAESELTAGITRIFGYALRFLLSGRISNLFIVSAVRHHFRRLDAVAYLGLDGFNAIMDYIPGFIWFFGKAFFVVFLLMWVKWTFPAYVSTRS